MEIVDWSNVNPKDEEFKKAYTPVYFRNSNGDVYWFDVNFNFWSLSKDGKLIIQKKKKDRELVIIFVV